MDPETQATEPGSAARPEPESRARDREPAARPEPGSRRRSRWWAALAGAAALALILLVVTVVAVTGREPGREAPGTAAGEPVVDQRWVPNLTGLTEPRALTVLKELGVQVWDIRYLHDPEAAGLVVGQSLLPGTPVDLAGPVTLEVGTALTAPVITSPLGAQVVPAGTPVPALTWEPGDTPPPYPHRWRVRLSPQLCGFPGGLNSGTARRCRFLELRTNPVVVGTPVFALEPLQDGVMPQTSQRYPLEYSTTDDTYFTGWVKVWVEPLDHFDNPGPASPVTVLRVGLRHP